MTAHTRVWVGIALLLVARGASAQIVETGTSPTVRPLYTIGQIATFMPTTRTSSNFPAPYGSKFWRVTLAADCTTIYNTGYSYWRNLSHDGDNLYIQITLDNGTFGCGGPTLFKLVKSTGVLTKVGPIFDTTDTERANATGERMYFSASLPTKFYYEALNDAATRYTRLKRIDVLTKVATTIVNIDDYPATFPANRSVFQAHSSFDDNVHVFTVRDAALSNNVGCGVVTVSPFSVKFFPQNVTYQNLDECSVDAAGQYLHIKEQVSGGGVHDDSRFIRLSDDRSVTLLIGLGGGGHSDEGYGYTVMAGPGASGEQATLLWDVSTSPLSPGTRVYHVGTSGCVAGFCGTFSHLSHLNATNAAASGQYALAGGVELAANNDPRTNELFLFKLDGSNAVLTFAPVMTFYSGYSSDPFANIDSTGCYALYTTNLMVLNGAYTAILVQIPPSQPGFATPCFPAPSRLRRIAENQYEGPEGPATITLSHPGNGVTGWALLDNGQRKPITLTTTILASTTFTGTLTAGVGAHTMQILPIYGPAGDGPASLPFSWVVTPPPPVKVAPTNVQLQ